MTPNLTRRRLRSWMVAAVLAVLTVLGGCSGSAVDSADRSSSQALTFNQADVKFAQTMIPHHEQAIEMSDHLLAKAGVDPEVTQLAQQMKAAQGSELATMKGFSPPGTSR